MVALDGTAYATVPGNSSPALNGIEMWPLPPTNQVMVRGQELVRTVGSRGASVALGRQYHLDAQGSVQATSYYSGSIETAYGLDAWGNVGAGNALDNSYNYVGGAGYWDDPDAPLTYGGNGMTALKLAHALASGTKLGDVGGRRLLPEQPRKSALIIRMLEQVGAQE
jgi:hypothetical protein